MFAGELPWQTVWLAEAVPPAEGRLTVTVTVVEFAEGQVPLVTTAR